MRESELPEVPDSVTLPLAPMAEEDKSTTSPPAPSEPLQESGSQSGAHQPSQSTVEENNRSELILRARIFLRSSQIQSQDVFAKRRFLLDKGLNENEIELLLRELVRLDSSCITFSHKFTFV